MMTPERQEFPTSQSQYLINQVTGVCMLLISQTTEGTVCAGPNGIIGGSKGGNTTTSLNPWGGARNIGGFVGYDEVNQIWVD